MKIPKEYAEKVKRYQELKAEAVKLFSEVAAWLNENTGADAVYVNELFLTDSPSGQLQEGDEYCDQSCGYCEDDFYGSYYHQIEGGNGYVGYSYTT